MKKNKNGLFVGMRNIIIMYAAVAYVAVSSIALYKMVMGTFLALLFALPVMSQLPYEAIKSKDGQAHAESFADAIKVNIRPELRSKLTTIVAAIRFAENGGKGREYGILHPRVKPTYRSQAGWCAATVQKNFDRWTKAGRKGDFITFLGNRYCPVGAENDPTGLNKHWQKNVRKLVSRLNKSV